MFHQYQKDPERLNEAVCKITLGTLLLILHVHSELAKKQSHTRSEQFSELCRGVLQHRWVCADHVLSLCRRIPSLVLEHPREGAILVATEQQWSNSIWSFTGKCRTLPLAFGR